MCAPELGSSFPALVVSERLLGDEGWARSAQAGLGTFGKEPQAGLAAPEVGQRWAKVLETEDVGRHGPSRGLSLASVLELQTIGPGCIYFLSSQACCKVGFMDALNLPFKLSSSVIKRQKIVNFPVNVNKVKVSYMSAGELRSSCVCDQE